MSSSHPLLAGLSDLSCQGIGVDIEQIQRFRDRPYQTGDPFYERWFTLNERIYCLSKPDPAPHFAARFCAKEAFVKAIGNRFLDYGQLEIVRETDGRIRLRAPFACDTLVSLSHTVDTAIAMVFVVNIPSPYVSQRTETP